MHVGILRTGRREPIDFIYQGSLGGERGQRGSTRPDFIIANPYMAINVQSRYYHSRDVEQVSRDQMARLFVETQGLPVAYISEDQARANADGAVRAAIASRGNTGPLGVLL